MKDQQLIDELHSAVGDRSNFSTILTQNKLIQEQVLINTTKYSLETINKNLSVAQYLLNALTTDVNFKSESDQTALHMLCKQESPSDEFIKVLIDAKADVNAQAEKETPLSIASINKNIIPQTLELMIKASLEQDSTQEKAKLALTKTVEEYVKSLVKASEAYKKIFLEGFTKDTFFTTPAYLNHKAIEGDSENLKNKIKLFVKNGLDINGTYYEGEALLHIATRSKDEVFLNDLLKQPGIDSNTTNAIGQTALHIACSSEAGSKKMIEVLLAQKNIDVNIRDENNNTPLGIIIKSTTEPTKPISENYSPIHIVEEEKLLMDEYDVPDISQEEMLIAEYEDKQISNRNYTKLIELFLKHGLDINTTYSNSKTLLHYAVKDQNLDLVEILLKQPNLKINQPNTQGQTALHIAAKNLNINMVTQLLSYKTIDVNVRDQNNNTPFNIIIKELKRPINLEELCGDMVNDPDVLRTFLMDKKTQRKGAICKYFELFLEHDLKVNDRYDEGKTLLHIAAEDNNYELVKLLIDNEVDNTIRDENGHFAYEYAEKNSEIYDLIYCRELKNPLSATPQYHYSPKSADIAKLDNKIESTEFLQDKAEENSQAIPAPAINLELREELIGDNIAYSNSIEEDLEDLFYYTATDTDNLNTREPIISLLEKNINPFAIDECGNSAFSIALRQANVELAKIFITSKKLHDNQIIKQLLDEDSATFCCTIASKVCSNDSTLRNIFGFNELGAQMCFTEAKEGYEILSSGMNSSFLLHDNIFI